MAYSRQRDARVAMCIIPCINVCTSARGCVEERVGCGSVKPPCARARAHALTYTRMCTRHLRRGVNDGGGTTTRVAGSKLRDCSRRSPRSSWHLHANASKLAMSTTTDMCMWEISPKKKNRENRNIEFIFLFLSCI